jgi:glutamyl-tRNA synthetase
MAKDGVAGILDEATSRLATLEVWETGAIEPLLRGMLDDLGIGAGRGLQPLRVAVTGSSVSPPLFESMAALGRERTLERLGRARARLDG